MGLFVLGTKAWKKTPVVSFKLLTKKEGIEVKNSISKLHQLSTSPSGFFASAVQGPSLDKRRYRRTYQDNNTMALALPYTNAQLRARYGNQSALLALSEANIIEHANRRIDLFFYTLMAYYRTNEVPVLGRTELQYGRGRTFKNRINLTQACHSSFTPSLKMLAGTHFLDSINSTVELPPFVNAFDDLLELICRPKALEILTDVALSKMNPIQGLTRFLKMMNHVLGDFKQQAAEKNYQALVHPSFGGPHFVLPQLIDLVYRGTLKTTFSVGSLSVNEDYIQLMLRLKAGEKACSLRAPRDRELLYMDKMMEIQREILETPSQTVYRPSQ